MIPVAVMLLLIPLTESECTISCATGYSIVSTIATDTCNGNTGKFTFEGCYNDNTKPTLKELAATVIAENKVFHLKAGSGVTLNGEDGLVDSWQTLANNTGQQDTFSRNGSTGPTTTTVNGVTFVDYTGNYEEKLIATTVDDTGNNSEFTRFFVFRMDTTDNMMLVNDDTVSGYDAYQYKR